MVSESTTFPRVNDEPDTHSLQTLLPNSILDAPQGRT